MLHFAVLHPSRYRAKNSPETVETVETPMVNSIWSFKFLAESVVMHMDGFSLILAWLEVSWGESLDPTEKALEKSLWGVQINHGNQGCRIDQNNEGKTSRPTATNGMSHPSSIVNNP